MFSDNLSNHLLQILDKERFSYEAAAELCGISPRHFGNIVRQTATPSIAILEKMCRGLEQTPDELLLGEQAPLSMWGTMVRLSCSGKTLSCSPVCPGCKVALTMGSLQSCGICAQRLGQPGTNMAMLLLPEQHI